MCLPAKSLHSCLTLCNGHLWTVACQAPLSVGFSRQEYWSGVGCHAFLKGIFQIQGSNLSLLWLMHCRWIIYCWSTREAQFLEIYISVEFSRSVVSSSLQPHGLQHARLPCPSPTPRASSNPCPSSQWCHPTISISVVPFSSCLQSFPASGSFQWVSSSHQVAKVLELQLQHQSFWWIFRTNFL